MQFRENAKYAIVVPTSMGVRICPMNGQPVQASDTFFMHATSAESNVVSIAAFLGMTGAEFIERETEIAPDRRGLILKSRPDGACAWLTEDNLCRINPVKPDKCRTFPLEWTNGDSRDICPGLRGASTPESLQGDHP